MDFSNQIKKKALEIGFSKIGIAKADFYQSDKDYLEQWIQNGFHGSMKWIENRQEERANIFKYYPNAKSVISLAINYFTGNAKDYFNNYKISNYSWGDDYHSLIKSKLYELAHYIKKDANNFNVICCVDTSPISEKVWAQRAGSRSSSDPRVPPKRWRRRQLPEPGPRPTPTNPGRSVEETRLAESIRSAVSAWRRR